MILHSMPTPFEGEQTEPVRWQLVIEGSSPLQTYPNPRKTLLLLYNEFEVYAHAHD